MQLAVPGQSPLLAQSATLGDEQLVAQADVALNPIRLSAPASVVRADASSGSSAQQTSPASHEPGPEHWNCSELLHAVRFAHAPTVSDKQHVSAWPHTAGPKGVHDRTVSLESTFWTPASSEGLLFDEEPQAIAPMFNDNASHSRKRFTQTLVTWHTIRR